MILYKSEPYFYTICLMCRYTRKRDDSRYGFGVIKLISTEPKPLLMKKLRTGL